VVHFCFEILFLMALMTTGTAVAVPVTSSYEPRHHFVVSVGWLFAPVAKIHSLTRSWSWALFEKPSVVQLLKNFPAFYGTRKFVTVFTRALHWSLSWTRSIQSTPSNLISQRSIFVFSTHLRNGLPSAFFPSDFATNILYAILFSQFVLHALPISSSLTWSF
jgi:hypothetical protein